MPRQSFSSVCPRRTPPIPVRRLIPAAEKENAPPRKGRTRKSREKENIESARGLLDIFAFVAKRRKCDFDAGRRAALIRHWRIAYIFQPLQNKKNELTSINSFLVGEGGFEPPKSLTTDLQSAPFGHSGIPPYSIIVLVGGAGRRIRTPDLLITNQLLYQLSYTSISATNRLYITRLRFVCQQGI